MAMLALCGCVASSAGRHSDGFISPAISHAYIPLHGTAYVVLEGSAAATVIAPGIAATNLHNENLVDPATVIGRSRDYDLMFFRTPRKMAPPEAGPRIGGDVIAYGRGIAGDVREAEGPVRYTDAPVLPACPSCPVQHAFAFQADGGEGFSGGPVVDARTGQLVGITFGFRDGLDDRHPAQRLMYAYDMKRVMTELRAAEAHASQTGAP